MADNVAITAGSGTAVAADDISSVFYQRFKLTLGADGESDGDVSSTNPMPVQPVEKTLVALSGTCASAGANTLVTAPGAGNRLVICGLTAQNEVATAQTLQIHEESTATKGLCFYCPADATGSGIKREFALGREWKLAENKGLDATLSAATTVGFGVLYFVEAV